ncbi:DUF3040 domain-containing protein [Nakamurella flava]|uniref:DUF3040 domain-containing protein n=1 Tax=Nakamurella flava TaxID=2576308 RepID=A0A4U6QJ71_9ACTN|nr:DUF3040 domain-containing protein [Nakamurella flava]TKV60321.1 DUF3040 domain-containing protein [Nakamurella flava]
MSLDENEQRQLDRIERQLRREDPTFAFTLDGGPDQKRRRQWRQLAGRLVGIGLVAMLIGLMAQDGLLSFGAIVLAYGSLSVAVGGVMMLRHRTHPSERSSAPDEGS